MKKRNRLTAINTQEKPVLLFVLLLLLIAAPVITNVACNNKQAFNPHLVNADLLFEFPDNAEQRFKEFMKDPTPAKIFKREKINVLCAHKNWVGRIKESGVSQQALFSIDNAKIIYKTTTPVPGNLNFSIFNPQESKLFYRIYLETAGMRKRVFSAFCGEKRFFQGHVALDSPLEKGARFVFETRGKGIGAWVNPRFIVKKNKPRIFAIIILDTLRYDHTSLYGYTRKTTPCLDKLAEEGRVFKNAYSSTSWTLPAHVSLFSGKDLAEHKVTAPADAIMEDYPLIAEVFQKNGFVTAAFTGGGFVDDHYGFHRGFQYYSNVPGRVFHLDSAGMVLRHFKNYIETYWGEDIFVFLHTYQAHAPYKFPPSYVRHFNNDLKSNLMGPANFIRDKKTEYYKPIEEKNRQLLIDLYDTAVYYADEALVGGFIQYLKDKDVYEKAMIVVAGDHGEEFYDHGSWEHGHSLYNELIRIPLAIKYPGNKNKGVENSLVSIADIPGILLKESGLRNDMIASQGANSPVFNTAGGEKKRVLPVLFPRSPIIEQVPPKISFVTEDYHFIYNIINPGELKVFNPQPRDLQNFELYEKNDINETNNLAKRNAPKLRDFMRLLKKYMQLLQAMKGKKNMLDASLQKELKSLGYLND